MYASIRPIIDQLINLIKFHIVGIPGHGYHHGQHRKYRVRPDHCETKFGREMEIEEGSRDEGQDKDSD